MKDLLQESVVQLGLGIDRFPWSDRRAYADWLSQTFHYVRHSTRLLAAAAARFPCDERGNAMHHRFVTHMAEEKKHELLCVHDLRVLGTSVASLPEHHSTRMFYEPQYTKIEHGSPVALFGYILPLEAIGPARGAHIADVVIKAHGDKCASFVRLHAEEDVEHLDKALQMLQDLPTGEAALVKENLRQTTYAYVTMLHDIRRQLDTAPAVLAG